MMRKVMLAAATSLAVFTGAAVLQPAPAQARVSLHLHIGPGWGGIIVGPRYYKHRCYVTHRRVKVRYWDGWRHRWVRAWRVRPVRVCRW